MSVLSVSGTSSESKANEVMTATFRCEICQKEFVNEAQLSFHKEIEHVKHLPISGVA
jgi:signal-transduction protein with cAMP-binding, CBS, and nucleotidyltransferase domain